MKRDRNKIGLIILFFIPLFFLFSLISSFLSYNIPCFFALIINLVLLCFSIFYGVRFLIGSKDIPEQPYIIDSEKEVHHYRLRIRFLIIVISILILFLLYTIWIINLIFISGFYGIIFLTAAIILSIFYLAKSVFKINHLCVFSEDVDKAQKGAHSKLPVFKKLWKYPRTKNLIIIFIWLIFVFSIVGAYSVLEMGPKYDMETKRTYSGPLEYEASKSAEAIDYSNIFEIKRYSLWREEVNEGIYGDYTWANFVDYKVISFYTNKIEYLRDNIVRTRASFEYVSEVESVTNFNIQISTEGVEITTEDGKDILNLEERRLWALAFVNDQNLSVFYGPKKDYRPKLKDIEQPFTGQVERGYLIKMSLYYTEYYAGLAAFGSDIDQYVLMNETYDTKLIAIKRSGWIS